MTTLTRAGRIAGCLAAAALCAVVGTAFAGEKTDIIELRNGDRVTCEIKNLERGQLKVSTDSMGTVYIEWKDVVKVTSKVLYVVELEDGSRLDGTLARSEAQDTLLLKHDGEEQAVDMRQVVWIDPLKLEGAIVSRWDGSISAGFDVTKANSEKSLSASFSARHRAEDYVLNFDGSMYSTLPGERNKQHARNLRRRLPAAARGALVLGGARRARAQRRARHRPALTRRRRLWPLPDPERPFAVVGHGRSRGRQRAARGRDAETSLESFFNTDYEFFTFDTPKTSLNTSLTLYPA